MRTLELTTTFKAADWKEYRLGNLTRDQRYGQELVRRLTWRIANAALWLVGIALFFLYVFAKGEAEAATALTALQGYGVVVVFALLCPFLLELFRSPKLDLYYSFADAGWQFFSRPDTVTGHEGIRQYSDIVSWSESKAGYHIIYCAEDSAGGSVSAQLWRGCNAPLAKLGARQTYHAMLPKRILSTQQITEIRSLLGHTCACDTGEVKV